MPTEKVKFLTVTQQSRQFILASIKAGILIEISYAAQRGVSDESGAVQRILNPSRISSIKQFTLENGDYPGAIVLNWVSKTNVLRKSSATITFDVVPNSAQIIDGQHRLAGIKSAIEENQDIYHHELPVAIYENLETRDCADIFLSINTEQKPVPRSLVYDLYGIASEPVVDPAAVRARDIALYLNDEDESPYFSNIKMPGAPKRKGGIALSTAVTALKPLVEAKGDFEQVGIGSLQLQKTIIANYFTALRKIYGIHWESNQNAFQYASGFVGAIDFFRTKLLSYCNNRNKKFTVQTMLDAVNLETDSLIMQDDVKGLGGKEAPKVILQRLTESLKVQAGEDDVEV